MRVTPTSKTMNFNFKQTNLFIKTLAGKKDEPCTFQTFPDHDKDKKELIKVLHGTLQEHGAELIRLNRAGAGVFVTVNKTDLTSRRTESITGLRALFVDFDNGHDLPKFPVEPTIIVKSAHGHHCYWKLKSNESISRFTESQKRLIKFFDSDTSIHDLPRVMRLPGFFHLKDKTKPFLVTIEKIEGQGLNGIHN